METMWFFAFLCIFSPFCFCINVTEYCNISKENTVCRRPSCEPSKNCQQVISAQEMTDEERKIILDAHNELRQKQASGAEKYNSISASNMNILGYSLEMEHLVQCWINDCDFNHDKGRGSPHYRSQGQNLYQMYAIPKLQYSPDLLEKAVDKWYNEVGVFNERNYFSGNDYLKHGHYTQVIWANTKLIGCAKILYKIGNKEYAYIGCNYYPSGNYPQFNIFEEGEPCSKCGDAKCNDKYPALCGETPTFPVDKMTTPSFPIDKIITTRSPVDKRTTPRSLYDKIATSSFPIVKMTTPPSPVDKMRTKIIMENNATIKNCSYSLLLSALLYIFLREA